MVHRQVPPLDDDSLDFNDPLGLGPARGGRKTAKPLEVEVVRELTPDDLPSLRQGFAPSQRSLTTIRHSHHQLAQLLARGTTQSDAALITGYSPSYISVIKDDPAFAELLSHYASVSEEKFADVLERMRSLGLSTLDELQSRLELEPENWSARELMEMAELLLVKPMRQQAVIASASGGSSGPAGVQVQVNFVTAQPALSISDAEIKTIEHDH
jgi:hypothetical protein